MVENGQLFELPNQDKIADNLPTFCRSSVLSSLLGISKKQISNLKTKGLFDSDEKDKYLLVDSVKSYCKYLKTGTKTKKAELDQAKLDRLLRENREADKELINLDHVCQIYMELGSVIVSHLEGFASRTASDVAIISDVAECQTFLYEECRKIREDIQRTVEESEIIKALLEDPETTQEPHS